MQVFAKTVTIVIIMKAQKLHVREMHHFMQVGSVQCAWSYNI